MTKGELLKENKLLREKEDRTFLKHMLLFNAVHRIGKQKFTSIEDICKSIQTENVSFDNLKNQWKNMMGFDWPK